MRSALSALLQGMLVTLVVAARASAQAAAPVAQHRATAEVRPASYSDREADFVAGKAVYLKSTKTRIGTIEATDSAHAFPKSFPHSPAKAVLLRHADGPQSWMPVEGITRIYVVAR